MHSNRINYLWIILIILNYYNSLKADRNACILGLLEGYSRLLKWHVCLIQGFVYVCVCLGASCPFNRFPLHSDWGGESWFSEIRVHDLLCTVVLPNVGGLTVSGSSFVSSLRSPAGQGSDLRSMAADAITRRNKEFRNAAFTYLLQEHLKICCHRWFIFLD